MADINPTGAGYTDDLTIPDHDRPFLRRVITAARDGLRGDLETHPPAEEKAGRLWRQLRTHDALLESLDAGEVLLAPERVPTRFDALRDLAIAVDRGNEYDQAVAEHDALARFQEQIEIADQAGVLAERGLSDPQRRAHLSNRLLDAGETVRRCSDKLADSLACNLEGRDADIDDARAALRDAREEFAAAVQAAGDFLDRAEEIADQERYVADLEKREGHAG